MFMRVSPRVPSKSRMMIFVIVSFLGGVRLIRFIRLIEFELRVIKNPEHLL